MTDRQPDEKPSQAVAAASRDELRRLAEEQAALRRVAMLVARGVPPEEVFDAVAEEMALLLGADGSTVLRHEADGSHTFVAARGTSLNTEMPVGARLQLGEGSLADRVELAGRPIRLDGLGAAPDWIGEVLRRRGVCCRIAAPILVEGRIWGTITAAWTDPGRVPAGAEERMAQFTELLATAIANAESRAQLTASRARIVAAADDARRRIERNLHDGTQQRLISLSLALRAAEEKVPSELAELRGELAHVAQGLAEAVEELQEISRGIHPAILARGGLRPALKSLARSAGVPVELDVRIGERLPARFEVAAYYVVSESLANAVKHGRASVMRARVARADESLELVVSDDGVGGADPARGSGLVGLKDRIEALGGTLEITSPPGRGTTLRAVIPLPAGSHAAPLSG